PNSTTVLSFLFESSFGMGTFGFLALTGFLNGLEHFGALTFGFSHETSFGFPMKALIGWIGGMMPKSFVGGSTMELLTNRIVLPTLAKPASLDSSILE
ncbi:hypothetical protein, partial [Serratia marcescens]|uniref:hypothetical protein n=1 Tax=Serratia marcescens TaxID=615 RepID=UPI0028133E48